MIPISGRAKKMKKICTRIGVFLITSTYTAVNWLTTGIRAARAAPSTIPITNDPAIAIAESSSVLYRASRSRARLSQMNDQEKL